MTVPVYVPPVEGTTPISAKVQETLELPLKDLDVPPIVNVLAFAKVEAVLAAISDGDHVTFKDPFTDLAVPPILIVLAVPQFAVVIFALPLNDVPLIVRPVCSVVAVVALPANDVAVIVPFTCRGVVGLFVPIPTLPVLLTRILSTPFVENARVFDSGRYIPLPVTTFPVGTNFCAVFTPVEVTVVNVGVEDTFVIWSIR